MCLPHAGAGRVSGYGKLGDITLGMGEHSLRSQGHWSCLMGPWACKEAEDNRFSLLSTTDAYGCRGRPENGVGVLQAGSGPELKGKREGGLQLVPEGKTIPGLLHSSLSW